MSEAIFSLTRHPQFWFVALGAAGILLVGLVAGYLFGQQIKGKSLAHLEHDVEEQLRQRLAEDDRVQRLGFLEEKDQWYKSRAEQGKALEAQLQGLNQREKSLAARDGELKTQREQLNKEWQRLKSQDRRLGGRDRALKAKETKVQERLELYRERLEIAAHLSADEAREQLLEHLAGEVRARAAKMIRTECARAREEAEREGRKILVQAIQRCAVEEAVQVSTATVSLPSEGLKSRIIGKEGRNVRAFEAATGVKVVVDDTPDTVLISSFDPTRREVASRAMQRLISGGGFTPGRIEEVVEGCKKELEEDMVRTGKEVLAEIGAVEYHPELPHYVGMFKYRTTVGQNLLQHCLEVAHLSGLLAAEVGLDVGLAKRAGLLHDIGKTVSRDMEGSHMEVGVELGKRFNEHPIVREVIAEHHEDSHRQSPIWFIVKAADTISSIRPGGRREDLEGYARRIMRLEEIANSFEGVKDVYAINAGREVRVMVRGDRLGDDDVEMLAFDIAERVKNELTFAGEVKVMVVRETRAVRYTGRGNLRRNGRGRRGRSGRANGKSNSGA